MDLSIIIVNWNSADYLKECLLSVFQTTQDVAFEIIVVDNASYDGARAMIEAEFPGVKFLQSLENGGFSRANNLGFRHSSGRNILFLNPDTLIIGPAISVLLHALESIPTAGAVGCRLLHSDHSLQLHSIQRYPTVMNQVMDLHFLKARFPQWSLWGLKPLLGENAPPAAVEVIPGACLMVRRSVFEQVGQFTDDYFMYAEDIDLCYKINQTDQKVYFVNGATVLHHGGGSSRNGQANSFQNVLMRESVFKFIGKSKGPAAALRYRAAMMSVAVSRLLPLLLVLPWLGKTERKESLSEVYGKWKSVFRWSVGLETWARELR